MSAAGATPIALVCGQLGYGGAERQLAELATRLRGQGFAASVYCLSADDVPYGPWLESRGVPVRRLPRRHGFDLARAVALARALRRDSAVLVHSYLIDTNPYSVLAARLAGISRTVASNRNVDFPRGPLRAALDRVVFRSASAIVVNAGAVRTFTAARFGVADGRFTVIYNGVDLERFHPVERPSGAPLRIGTVGRLEPKKNPELFVDVALALARRFPGLEVVHLGDGPLRDALVRRAGDAVRFLGASVDVESFLASLDVFVLTSDREGCPNVALEAMASGLPVVTTAVGGASEIVREGITGYLVPRADAAAMIERVGELLGDAEQRRLMGWAARREAECRFSVERMVEEMATLYRRLLGRSGNGA